MLTVCKVGRHCPPSGALLAVGSQQGAFKTQQQENPLRHLTEVSSKTSQGSVIVQLGEESECVESCFCPWHPRERLAQPAQPCNPDPSGGHRCFSGGANSSGSGLASLSPCCYFLFKTSQHRGERYAGQQKAATENRSIRAICKGELKHDYDPHTSPVTKSSFPRALASAFQRGKSLSTIRHQC